jgi:type I restriction enzyme S subunit
LLEGLEVSILNLKEALIDNENKRIDSEYFKKQYLKFFHDVPNLRPLGSLAKDGYRVVYENTKIIDKSEAQQRDYPIFLQATDLRTPFIKTDNLFYVDNEQWERYPKGRIVKGEILIEVKGKIDKVAIVPDDFPEKTLVTGSLFKLTVNNKISKHVLLTYLISKFGVAFKDRYKTNLLISFVSKPDLYRIPVPTFGKSFENLIDDLFHLILKNQKESENLYKLAESTLLKYTSLLEFEPNLEPINVKSFKSSFGKTKRLDAEYYQKKYEQLISIIESQTHDILNNIADISKSIEPGSNYYSEDDGLPFYRVSDYNKFGLSKPDKELTNAFVADNKELIEKLIPKKGTILFSKDGSVGTAYLLRDDLDGITSGAILHLKVKNSKEILPEYLTLALNSKLVQMQAERDAGGSIILHWRKEEIEQVVVPIIDFTKQKQIAELVEESFKLKTESERLLEVAKKAVEIAIEMDEATAIKFIKDRS